jgi:tetratricopeptide (TPR) repeat protein
MKLFIAIFLVISLLVIQKQTLFASDAQDIIENTDYNDNKQFDELYDYFINNLSVLNEKRIEIIIERTKKSRKERNLIKAYILAGDYYRKTERIFSKSYYYYDLASQLKDISHKSKIDLLQKYGLLYKTFGQYDKAISYYMSVINESEKLSETEMNYYLLQIYGNIGNIFRIKKNYNKALEYYQKSEEIIRKNDSNSIIAAIILQNIASLQLDYNHIASADSLLKISSSILVENNDTLYLAENYSVLGYVEYKKKDYKSALDYFFKSYELFKESKYLNKLSSVLANIAETYYYLGDLDESINYYELSLETYNSQIHEYAYGALHGLTKSYLAKAQQLSKTNPIKSNYYYKKYSDIVFEKDSIFEIIFDEKMQKAVEEASVYFGESIPLISGKVVH